ETIALKCMAKDPAQRYASARALADDLDLYLDGQPIVGRRPTLRQRLRASMRKHRGLYTLGAASSAALMIVGALGVRSYLGSRAERARSVERTQLAERLGRDAKDIELLLHTTYQLPLHDARRERDQVRARMKAIAEAPHDLGALGDAVVHDALGRGHLALHEWAAALAELERAEQGGLDTPELHAARGRALGELYHRALEEARRSGNKSWLAARERELEKQYLAPALAELERARGAADSSALLDVLVALYRHDYVLAKTRALAIAESTPWVFEARKLAADAVYAAAVVDVDRGNYAAALPQLEQASALYAQAAEVARSDASVYEAAAQARFTRADIDHRQGRDEKPVHDDALASIDRAITADPDDSTAYTTKAYILLLRSRAKVDGPDRRPVLEQAAAAAQRAVTLDAKDAGAWDALGNAHVSRGTYEAYHGGAGETWWRTALDEFAHALAIRPEDPWTNNDVGIAHRWLGTTLAATGGDPMPDFRAALEGYRHATAVDPGYAFAWSNQSEIAGSIADYQLDHGVDPRPALDDAVRAGERGLAADPSQYLLLEMMASAEIMRAGYLADTGADPIGALAVARAYLDRA
ncbi:MAG: serine/threonine protein kinase, partial [Polyangiales bacterium]